MMRGLFFLSSILISMASTQNAFAVTASDAELNCTFLTATTIRAYTDPKITLNNNKGTLTLKKEGDFFKGELVIDTTLKLFVQAQIKTEFMIDAHVEEVRYSYSTPTTLSIASAIFNPLADGTFGGTLILRNPVVSSLALSNKFTYEDAAISEKLSSGINFIGAYINCL